MDYIIELTVLCIDSIILPILYYSYYKDKKILKNIENVKEININDLNKETNQSRNVINYCMISGCVEPKNNDLQSNYSMKNRGVMKVLTVRRHGISHRNSPFTEDFARKVSENINSEPFYLTIKKSKNKIEVIGAEKADLLIKDLDTTYKNYEPINQSLLSALLSSAFSREMTTGIEITEKMLKNGTILNAYGRLEKISDNFYTISKPLDSDYQFILTKQDRNIIISDLKSTIKSLKNWIFLFGSIGVLTSGYLIYQLYKKYKEAKTREKLAADLRKERLRIQRERLQNYDTERNNNNNTISNEQTCVLCLENPREIVLLDCGHFCLCIDCTDRLPNQKCPICRQQYQSYARCYNP